MTHICVGKLTSIASDNGLSPGRRQAIVWTNDGILLIRTLGTNFSEILSEIHSFSFKKTHLKMSSAKWRLSRLGLNEIMHCCTRQWLCSMFFVWSHYCIMYWMISEIHYSLLNGSKYLFKSHDDVMTYTFSITGSLWRESIGQQADPPQKGPVVHTVKPLI